MTRLSLILFAALLSGCLSDWEIGPPAPLYLGSYEVDGYSVGWYYHSLITSTTDPVVVVQDSTGAVVDTVAVSNHIFDIQTPQDSLILYSCHPIELRHTVGLDVGVVIGQEERCQGQRAGGRERSM